MDTAEAEERLKACILFVDSCEVRAYVEVGYRELWQQRRTRYCSHNLALITIMRMRCSGREALYSVMYIAELSPSKELFTDMIQYINQSDGSENIIVAPSGSAGDGEEVSKTQKEKERKRRMKAEIVTQHTDFIRDEFWQQRPWLLSDTGT